MTPMVFWGHALVANGAQQLVARATVGCRCLGEHEAHHPQVSK